jgi:hypothetical protein
MARTSQRFTRGFVEKSVLIIVCSVLNRSEDAASPTVPVRDLGAKFTNYLNIVLRLEDWFNIVVPRFEDFVLDGRCVLEDGSITADGLEKLRGFVSRDKAVFDLTPVEEDPCLDALANMITIRLIANFVCAELGDRVVA